MHNKVSHLTLRPIHFVMGAFILGGFALALWLVKKNDNRNNDNNTFGNE